LSAFVFGLDVAQSENVDAGAESDKVFVLDDRELVDAVVDHADERVSVLSTGCAVTRSALDAPAVGRELGVFGLVICGTFERRDRRRRARGTNQWV